MVFDLSSLLDFAGLGDDHLNKAFVVILNAVQLDVTEQLIYAVCVRQQLRHVLEKLLAGVVVLFGLVIEVQVLLRKSNLVRSCLEFEDLAEEWQSKIKGS